MSHTPHYILFWAIVYTDKEPDKQRKVFEAPIQHIRQKRAEAFGFMDSLKDTIESSGAGNILSWAAVMCMRPMEKGEIYLAVEGDINNRAAYEIVSIHFDLDTTDILIGLHLEYEHYAFWKLLSGEPGIITNEQDRQIEVLPEVVDRLMS